MMRLSFLLVAGVSAILLPPLHKHLYELGRRQEPSANTSENSATQGSDPAASCDPMSGWCKGGLQKKYDVDSHPLKPVYDQTEKEVNDYRQHEYEFEDQK